MLQNMRDNLKGFGVAVVVIISIPFIFTGTESLFTGSAVEQAAEVNGERISRYEVSRGVELQKQQLKSQYGDSVLQFLSDEMLQGQVLNQLVQQKAVKQAAIDAGLGVSEQSINESLMETAAFQVDGKFDGDRFQQVIQNIGLTPSTYTEQMRADFLAGQMLQGVAASDFITEKEVASGVALAEQNRSFYYLTLPIAPLLAEQQVSDEALAAHYETVKDQLIVPEQVVVDYIELSQEVLAGQQSVTEAQIQERFDSELSQLGEPALQQRLAHILVDTDSENSEQLVADLQAKLAAGENFAELAKQYSQDPGTAELGGDLGFIDPEILPEALATAAEGLTVGAVSEPVETDSGIHLLTVTEEQRKALPTLAEQSARIEQELKRELAQEQYETTLEALKDAVYSAETLAEPAAELKLAVEQSEPFSRTGGEGVARYPALVSAVFTDDVLTGGYASEVIELGNGTAIVAKLKERIPERTKALDDVKDKLLTDLKTEAAEQALKQQAEALLARVKAGESVEAIAKEGGFEWQVSLKAKRSANNADRDALSKAFELAAPQVGQSVADFATKLNGDQVLVELTAVEYPVVDSLPKTQLSAFARNLASNSSERGTAFYQQWLVDQADVELMQ